MLEYPSMTLLDQRFEISVFNREYDYIPVKKSLQYIVDLSGVIYENMFSKNQFYFHEGQIYDEMNKA